MQDYNPKAGFVEATGAIMFRGEGWKLWAGDSQPGTVLKAYREHQMSAGAGFLKELWPRIRKSMEFMIGQDGNDDGLVEGQQHNTFDINFFGPNTMVGSLYLAALRAAEEMAHEVGDTAFAARCRRIFEAGRKNTVEHLYNGEYFIQKVDLKKHPEHQYADGCLSDQLFGQGWAHQVALGYVYPKDKVLAALHAIWKYNWAPDVGPQNKAHPPQRWFARPGEAGLFTCTWPKSAPRAEFHPLSRRSLDGHGIPGRRQHGLGRAAHRSPGHLPRHPRALSPLAAQPLERDRVRRPLLPGPGQLRGFSWPFAGSSITGRSNTSGSRRGSRPRLFRRHSPRPRAGAPFGSSATASGRPTPSS